MRVPVVGLVGRPGQRRELRVDVPPSELGDEPWGPVVDALVGSLALDLTLESVTEGILVRGTVGAHALATCARCLASTTLDWQVELTELHRPAPPAPATGRDARRDGRREGRRDERRDATSDLLFSDDEDSAAEDLDYELVEGDQQLELDRMVRDALVIGQPVRVLCRPDCAGLCPTCGADRNVEPCDHAQEAPIDPRWEALRGLRLPRPDAETDGA
jgi:uncharacterized protein